MLNRILKLETSLNNDKTFSYKFVHFFLDRFNFSIPYRLHGMNITLPLIYGMGFYHLLPTEFWMVKLLKRLYGFNDGAFFDVGANLGQTLLRFKSLNLDEAYYGFEPNSGSFLYLTELIRKNNFIQSDVFPIALSNERKISPFYRRHRSDVSSTLIKNFKAFTDASNKTNVFVFKGDDIVENLGLEKIGILKIDAEGAELEVLRGFKNTIVRHRPFIICEILPVYHLNSTKLLERKKREEILLNEIAHRGYSVFRIKTDLTLELIKKIKVHSRLADTNYLFVPQEKTKNLYSAFILRGTQKKVT